MVVGRWKAFTDDELAVLLVALSMASRSADDEMRLEIKGLMVEITGYMLECARG